MSPILIALSIGVVGAAAGVLALWYRGAQPVDLGSVSATWIAELRAGDPYDPSR